MIKVSSLDFLNYDILDVDIKDKGGNILLPAGSKLDAGIILKYYFKEIYIDDVKETSNDSFAGSNSGFAQSANGSSAISGDGMGIGGTEGGAGGVSANASGAEDADAIEGEESETGDVAGDNSSETQEEEKDLTPLVYDKEEAARIAKHAARMGSMFKFTDEQMDEVKKVALFCNVGITNFTVSDLENKNFDIMKAHASYERVQSREDLSEAVKLNIKTHENKYNSAEFALSKNIPYAHIVGIACTYEALKRKYNDKYFALAKMLEYGGNRFNIFILHKFIRYMRVSDD